MEIAVRTHKKILVNIQKPILVNNLRLDTEITGLLTTYLSKMPVFAPFWVDIL